MKFSVDAKSLIETVAKARKLCPRATDVNLEIRKKKTPYLVVSADNFIGEFVIPNLEIDDYTNPVTVPIDPLLGALRNRKILTFESGEGELHFTDKAKYKGKLSILDYEPIAIPDTTDTEAVRIDINDETAKTFNEVIDLCYLTGKYSRSETMTLYLKCEETGLSAYCFDTFYLVKVEDKTIKMDESQTVTVDLANMGLIASISDKQAYTLDLSEEAVRVTSDTFSLYLPALQVSDVESKLADVDAFLDDWVKDKSTEVTCSTSDLNSSLDTISTFYETGTPIVFSANTANALVLSIKGKGGEIKEKIVATVSNPNKVNFSCEYDLLGELLPKVSEGSDVTINFVPDRILYAIAKTKTRRVFVSSAILENA